MVNIYTEDVLYLFFGLAVVVLAVWIPAYIFSYIVRSDNKRFKYKQDGFLNPKKHPFGVTDHARERFAERMALKSHAKMDKLAFDAYRYGKSRRQLNKAAAQRLKDIEKRQGGSVALLYKNYVYIFSRDNSLITLYEYTDSREKL